MSKRNIIIGVGVVALAIAWYAFRPELLFVNKTVSEEFPGGAAMASIEKGPTAVTEGNFKGLAHETKGLASIYQLADGKRTLRLTEFETSNGPGASAWAPPFKRYRGGVHERDSAYHQGTVWPWLIGFFVEAWLRIRGRSENAKSEARSRFLTPLLEHLNHAGLGHVSEIADAESPYTPRGCPFQAWSLAELLRLERVVLADNTKSITGASLSCALTSK
jgi:hypothetical protein